MLESVKMMQLIKYEKLNKNLKDKETWNFNIDEDGIYIIVIAARCKNWLQNWKKLFNDDDLAIQINDYLFAEIKGKRREFASAGSWNGNELKNTNKKIFFILPLNVGQHKIVFWTDCRPFLEEIKILCAEKKEINLSPGDISGIKNFDIIIKNLATEELVIKAKADADSKLELKVDGKTQLNQKYQRYKKWYWYGKELRGEPKEFKLNQCWISGVHSLEFRGEREPKIESVAIKIGGDKIKYKIGHVKLWKDIVLSDVVNLRSGPYTKNCEVVAELRDGQELEIINERVIGEYQENLSEIWHEVIFEKKRGFVLSSYIEIEGHERERIIDLIKEKSSRYDADSNLILAIAGCESHFKPFAHSVGDFLGIFQLGNDTALDMGVGDRYDFYQNIEGGIKYFKWIEKQIVGRGNIIEKRLVAWRSGIEYMRGRKVIDYIIIPNAEAVKKFVKNVLENYKKRDWFKIIWLPAVIILAAMSFLAGALFIENRMFASILIGGDRLPTEKMLFSKTDGKIENSNLKVSEKNIIFNDSFEKINRIIVRELRDSNMLPYTEMVYWSDRGEFREILTGFFSNAGWIYFQAGGKIFWIEREEGKYSPSTLYLPKDGRLLKIKFLEEDGQTWDEGLGPFEILNVGRGIPIFREYKYMPGCPNSIREYEYDYGENIFREIKQETPIKCINGDAFRG